jgi:hypothetical protein
MSAPDITQAFATAATGTTFADTASLNAFFTSNRQAEFIPWFNSNFANKGAWANKAIGTSTVVADRFEKIWDLSPVMFGNPSFNLLQFCCLMSIFINEVGRDLLPVTEKVGLPGHPGLAYPFDTIPGIKKSYNQATNKTAFECFTDVNFRAAHGTLPPAALLAAPDRAIWAGQIYPQSTFPTTLDQSQTGFIQEADFYKFRGRGFIQATWRDMYLRCIQHVQAYTGSDAKILEFKTLWAAQNPDKVATQSTNAQWDDLFQNSDLEMACRVVFLHNDAHGKYLALSPDATVLNSKTAGSVWNMGFRISGGSDYADLFRSRVFEMFAALGNGANVAGLTA